VPARVSAPIDHLVAAARENFYKNLLDIGGSTMVIVPTADPTYGALTAATFKTMGAAAITVTPSTTLSAFTNPVATQGIMPYIDLNGAASGGNLLTVATDGTTANVFDGGGVVGAWINPRSDGGGNIGRLYNKSTNEIKLLSDDGTKTKIIFGHTWTGTNGVWKTTSTELVNDTIALLIVEYDGDDAANDAVITMNEEVLSLTITRPTTARTSDASAATIIGNLGGGDRTFDGWISTFFTIDATITAAKRRAIYELGRGVFNY
jgi:hypothetical protein